jgi:hypothetical protein
VLHVVPLLLRGTVVRGYGRIFGRHLRPPADDEYDDDYDHDEHEWGEYDHHDAQYRRIELHRLRHARHARQCYRHPLRRMFHQPSHGYGRRIPLRDAVRAAHQFHQSQQRHLPYRQLVRDEQLPRL